MSVVVYRREVVEKCERMDIVLRRAFGKVVS